MAETYLYQVENAGVPCRLDRWLVTQHPHLSRAQLQRFIHGGAVQVEGRVVCSPAYLLKSGQSVALLVPEAVAAQPVAQAMPLDVIYEDAALLVINKPAGLVVHPAAGNPDHTLVNALLAYCGDTLSGIGGVKRPGIVHRLDKDTSGLMVVAKQDAAHQGLCAQFAGHRLARTYTALLWGFPKQQAGVIAAPIGRSPSNRKKMAALAKGGKAAVTHYQITDYFSTLAAACVCQLQTGRTHQIRVHLAHLGHSLIGDPLYGRAAGMKQHPSLQLLPEAARHTIRTFPRQALHASQLSFTHPLTQQSLTFHAPLPEDMQLLWAALDMTRGL